MSSTEIFSCILFEFWDGPHIWLYSDLAPCSFLRYHSLWPRELHWVLGIKSRSSAFKESILLSGPDLYFNSSCQTGFTAINFPSCCLFLKFYILHQIWINQIWARVFLVTCLFHSDFVLLPSIISGPQSLIWHTSYESLGLLCIVSSFLILLISIFFICLRLLLFRHNVLQFS